MSGSRLKANNSKYFKTIMIKDRDSLSGFRIISYMVLFFEGLT